jgi:hypothetical protein
MGQRAEACAAARSLGSTRLEDDERGSSAAQATGPQRRSAGRQGGRAKQSGLAKQAWARHGAACSCS